MPDKVQKFIDSLSKKIREKIKKRLVKLKSDPYWGQDIKKMKGREGQVFRLSIGKIRIIYRVQKDDIEIVDIDYRGSIY